MEMILSVDHLRGHWGECVRHVNSKLTELHYGAIFFNHFNIMFETHPPAYVCILFRVESGDYDYEVSAEHVVVVVWSLM